MTRRFLLRLPDGRTFPGAEFPSGHAVVNHPEDDMGGWFTVATTVGHLTDNARDRLFEARLEWIDAIEEQP